MKKDHVAARAPVPKELRDIVVAEMRAVLKKHGLPHDHNIRDALHCVLKQVSCVLQNGGGTTDDEPRSPGRKSDDDHQRDEGTGTNRSDVRSTDG